MSLKLFELVGIDETRPFSPYCWRTRMALAHKGLPAETIPWRFTEKGAIAPHGSEKVPVLLDGVNAGAAALVAAAFAPHAVGACLAGHRSVEPAHRLALAQLGLDPLIDLAMRLGEGTGALLALPVAQGAARALRDVATFDAAGVTDKEG